MDDLVACDWAKASPTSSAGFTLTFKTSATGPGSAYTLCEAVEPPDSGAGLHRHASYDETHIICEGRYEARLGDETLQLSAGDMFFAPRGTPHSLFAQLSTSIMRQSGFSQAQCRSWRSVA